MLSRSKTATKSAIEVHDIAVEHGGNTPIAVSSFHLNPGEKVLVTGKSGVGKSTLLQCILGFVPLKAGFVSIFGHRVDGHSIWRLRSHIAYVPQEAELGHGKVQSILEEPFTYRANSHLRVNLTKISGLFERFLLPEKLLNSDVDTLSGGEKQRIAIVGAILLSRPIYLLDEISSALDASSKDRVIEYFAERTDEAILTVSHDDRWKSFANRVIELR